MTNPLAALGLTTRSVSTIDLDGRQARKVVLSRTFGTDRDDLWHALTDPERLPRWFLPVSGELKVGGSYQFEGNAGGTVEACDPPRSLRVTWMMGDQPSWLTLTLEPDAAGTRLELEHLGHVAEEFWTRYGPGATGLGWDLAVHGLGLHLASGEPNDPAVFAAWTVSPEGIEFVETAASAWRQADVAGGAGPDEATGRAARTAAFYTGRAEPQD